MVCTFYSIYNVMGSRLTYFTWYNIWVCFYIVNQLLHDNPWLLYPLRRPSPQSVEVVSCGSDHGTPTHPMCYIPPLLKNTSSICFKRVKGIICINYILNLPQGPILLLGIFFHGFVFPLAKVEPLGPFWLGRSWCWRTASKTKLLPLLITKVGLLWTVISSWFSS